MTKPEFKINGYSTALFSTWYFVEELSLLFDCGDGVAAGLLQKSGKIKHVFISHADRDHLGGLFQFLQLNSRPELKIYFPKDSGSFPAIAEFSSKFDPHVSNVQWIPMVDGDEASIRHDMVVAAKTNRHIAVEADATKSLSFFVQQTKRKLKPEFQLMSQQQIIAAKQEGRSDELFREVRSTVLAYSGDTPIETDGRFDDANVLIHEATFLTEQEIDPDNDRRNKHSSLDQVLAMVACSRVRCLILGHFSSRYSASEIDDAIRCNCENLDLKIPVFRVLPGERASDLLANHQVSP